jgi:hypothetical protein
MKTLKELAIEALAIQNASNLCGLVQRWAKVMLELKENLPHLGTDEINRHPISYMWASKCFELSGSFYDFDIKYTECEKLTK